MMLRSSEEIHTMFEDSVSTFSVVVADVDTGTVFTLATFSDTGSVSVSANSENYTVTATPVGDWSWTIINGHCF